MATVDLVIRGGMVFDGSGGAPSVVDIAVDRGLILAVGAGPWRGREEIAAEVIYREGLPTGELPGKLVNGRQSAPALLAAE